MGIIKESIIHAGMDSLKILPFLFVASILVELLEHYTDKWKAKNIISKKKIGPVLGAATGCIPQCGVSVAGANLYAERMISRGTLLALLISTSDEAFLIFAAHGHLSEIMLLLSLKILIAMMVGYGANLIFAYKTETPAPSGHMHPAKHCCDGTLVGIIRAALAHTMQLFCFLFLFSLGINLLLEWSGEDGLMKLLFNDSVLQPLAAAAIGLIPGCAPTVFLSKLYLDGLLSFASLLAGLCTATGFGFLTLLKCNRDRKDTLLILLILYVAGVVSGILIHVLS